MFPDGCFFLLSHFVLVEAYSSLYSKSEEIAQKVEVAHRVLINKEIES